MSGKKKKILCKKFYPWQDVDTWLTENKTKIDVVGKVTRAYEIRNKNIKNTTSIFYKEK